MGKHYIIVSFVTRWSLWLLRILATAHILSNQQRRLLSIQIDFLLCRNQKFDKRFFFLQHIKQTKDNPFGR